MSRRLSLLVVLAVSICWMLSSNPEMVAHGATPTGGQTDPFGAGAFSNAPDPFGGGATSDDDPFGSSGAQQGDDPFGAPGTQQGNDPFGKPATKQDDDPFSDTPAKKPQKKPATKPKPSSEPARSAEGYGVSVSTTRAFPSLTPESTMQRAARARIVKTLAETTQFEYLEEALSDVINDIAFRHEIPIVIDITALEDYGIATDEPITMSLKNVSLRSALKLMLQQIDLTYLISDEVLHITTPEAATERMVTHFYKVAELLPPKTATSADEDEKKRGAVLIDLIMTLVEPDSWDEVGGPGSVQYVAHLETLAISHTEEVLVEVDYLLATLQEVVDARK